MQPDSALDIFVTRFRQTDTPMKPHKGPVNRGSQIRKSGSAIGGYIANSAIIMVSVFPVILHEAFPYAPPIKINATHHSGRPRSHNLLKTIEGNPDYAGFPKRQQIQMYW